MYWQPDIDAEKQTKIDKLAKKGYRMYDAIQALNVSFH